MTYVIAGTPGAVTRCAPVTRTLWGAMNVHRTEDLQRFNRVEPVEPMRLEDGSVMLVCLLPRQSWCPAPSRRLTVVVSEGQGHLESAGALVTIAASDVVTISADETVRIAADQGGLVAIAVGG